MHISEYALVYGPADIETEVGVKSETHVCEILVAQKFEKHGRHSRFACLYIRLVPHLPPCP